MNQPTNHKTFLEATALPTEDCISLKNTKELYTKE